MLQIKYLSIDRLVPYARNSRTHSDAQVAQIAASIREFGFTNPVLVDEHGGIIAGHGRVLAARKLGLEQVPAIELAGLSKTQRKAYIIADNQIALNAGWDKELLKLEIEDLKIDGFELNILGFEQTDFEDLESNIEDDVKDLFKGDVDNKYQLLIEYDSEYALNKAFNEVQEKGLKCKIIQ